MSLLLSPLQAAQSSNAHSAGTDIFGFMQSEYAGCAAIFSDLDGCLISSDTVLPGVTQLVSEAGDRLWIVSNNSTDTSRSLAARLKGLGLAIAHEHILLADEVTIRKIAKQIPGIRITLYASELLTELAVELGLKPCRGEKSDIPQLALLTRDPAFFNA
ncbi:ribonucleotide monophosphatase NagD (HAD superfamily) [Paenochrobactrum gallinarii]|uniref:Ribonucleotide monophosphatase NagD (HAD superfamily) n=1 Tax=Paenochrobactrum gallinarii TaxID=643673 RepID=A0A841LVQ6_9HYPH|nr:hypothetical protein [Paenochrobactrum gallinarii]MBB6262445.1 ribonucleotide monophosphatase NagD (HAD superfamily) [Paenochrobactrum gallinarii]